MEQPQGSLAIKLRVLRAERGLTIEEAAEKAKVMPDTISDAERGKRHPYLPTLRKIAEGYGVPVEVLLEAEEARRPKEAKEEKKGGKGEKARRQKKAVSPKAGAPQEEPGQPPKREEQPKLEDATPENVVTFPPGAVEEVLKTFKEGKISLQEASRAIADLSQGGPVDPTQDALERIQEEEEAEKERSRSREEVEA
jgi:transcriptional regulator with XRE-family HTH domain